VTAPALVVLAAGLGSRYGGPKQFDPIGPGGSTLMDYALFDAWRAGFRRAVFVLRPESVAEVMPGFSARYGSRFELAAAPQRLEDLPSGFGVPPDRTRPWGTTQAVLAAAPLLDGPFAVLNADDFYGRHAIDAIAGFLRAGHPPAHHAVIGYPLELTASSEGGVNRALLAQAPDGTLSDITEVRDLVRQADGTFMGRAAHGPRRVPGDALVSMNLWAFGAGAVDPLREAFRSFLEAGPDAGDECYLPDAVRRLIQRGEGQVTVIRTHGQWCGVTYASDRSWVASILAEFVGKGEYPGRIWT
jgi:hypothetical protein